MNNPFLDRLKTLQVLQEKLADESAQSVKLRRKADRRKPVVWPEPLFARVSPDPSSEKQRLKGLQH